MGSDEERHDAKKGRERETGWVGGDWFTRRGRKCNIHTSRLPDSVQNAMFGQSGKTKINLNKILNIKEEEEPAPPPTHGWPRGLAVRPVTKPVG
jgi:hypothetical protein